MPQNSVYSIIQTLDGYLWFTTLDGLVRYDGVRFTVFDKSNTKGLASNRFRCLYEDKSGTLWICTEGGLSYYRDGVFKTVTTADGLPDDLIFDIQADPDGGVLMVTRRGYGTWRDNKYIPYPGSGLRPRYTVYYGPSGIRWTLSNDGLEKYADGKTTVFHLAWPPGTPASPNTLFEDRNGDLWAAAGTNNVYEIRKDGVIRLYGDKDGIPHFSIRSFAEDNQGNIWLCTIGGGLVRFKDDHFTTYREENGLSNNDVWRVLQDREGTIWIGTGDGGINRLTRQFITSFSKKDGLVGDNVYPIFNDHSGDTWIGTTTGFSRLHNGYLTNYLKEPNNPEPPIVHSFFEDDQNTLWVGLISGLFSFNDGKLIPSALYNSIIGKAAVWVIYQDRARNLWVGTEKGLLKINDNQGRLFTVDQGLPNNEIRDIYEDRSGNLWIATAGGMARLKDDHFTVYTLREGLCSNYIRTIYEDKGGVLWFGSYDGGLSRFANGKFTNYTVENGLYNNGVFAIMEDNHDNFWISCNRGIYRVNHQQLNDFAAGKITRITCIGYGKQDGLINPECNGGRQPSALKTPDGKLWFPTQAGVAIVDPEAMPINPLPPPVLIESVMIDRSKAAWGNGIKLLPGQSNLEIQYTGLSFVKPDQVRFKYKMNGLDPDWIDAGTRRSVVYSHLPPGSYTFTVIAANSDGIWNDAGASMQITILPPFWRTWWFISISIVLAAGMVAFIYWRRVSQLHREKKAQEMFSQRLIDSQESERKRIAAELHDSLSQNIVIIKNRALLSLSTPDDHERAIEQIEEIAEAANQSLTEVREIAHNLRPFQIDRLGMTKAIEAMANKITATTAVRVKTHLDVIDGLLTPEMEIHLYRIIQESLNNIIKHAAASEAEVTIIKSGQIIEIIIQDNGCGFVPASRGESRNGGGFGLLGLTERARILGCIPVIQSSPGSGTRIELSIPVRESKNGD
ncbi:MAG TPA: two-component regulator propeller domain-containing protein [Blastocatellia bacterium]|nr:two-component regulator propeller domain-containing protein [Blastocatellia bacterium]